MRRADDFNIRDNESGIILVTVLLLTIVLSILAIGILSLNISRVTTSQSVVDSIKADYLARGAFIYEYQQNTLGEFAGAYPSAEGLDGKTFTISAPYPCDPPEANCTLFSASFPGQ